MASKWHEAIKWPTVAACCSSRGGGMLLLQRGAAWQRKGEKKKKERMMKKKEKETEMIFSQTRKTLAKPRSRQSDPGSRQRHVSRFTSSRVVCVCLFSYIYETRNLFFFLIIWAFILFLFIIIYFFNCVIVVSIIVASVCFGRMIV